MPTITVNGETLEFDDGTTIRQVLEALNLRPEVVGVELNGLLVRNDAYEQRTIGEGDELEYLHYMAGGQDETAGELPAGGQVLITKRVRFSFPLTKVKDPVIYRLVKDYDLIPNIRRANIEAGRGWVVLEISGTAETLRRGFDFVRGYGVDIEPVEEEFVEG